MASQTTPTLPNDVAQIAATNQLGPFAQAYQPSGTLRATGGLCLIIVSTIPCITFFTLLRQGVAIPGGIAILLIVAAILFGIPGYMLRDSPTDGSAVYLFEHGIVYSQKGQHTPLPWSQIASCVMQQGRQYSRRERCVVMTKDGRSLPIGKLVGYKELATSIKNHIGAQEMQRES